MILAITERVEDIRGLKPFRYGYYLNMYFKEVFDDLDILLFPIVSDKDLDKVCEICDGLVVTGSRNDVPPHYYGEDPLVGKDYSIDNYALDKKLIEVFYKSNKPIMGICGGMQSINVFFGGTLNQRIENHQLRDCSFHKISIEKGSFLENVYRADTIDVNSFHVQSVNKVADGFSVSARADDGTIEAIEKDNIVAVQWHPETMRDTHLFGEFIRSNIL